jgi:hypothetical protein
MAVALGFAVMFATLITLILVPCLYIILGDIGALFKNTYRRIFKRRSVEVSVDS